MRIIYSFILILVFVACNRVTISEEIQNSELILKYFTVEDMNEIEKIISFVDSAVSSSSNGTNIAESYHIFIDSIFQNRIKAGQFQIFDNSRKIKLLNNIKHETLNKFWRTASKKNNKVFYDFKSEKEFEIGITSGSNFSKFILELEKKNSFYKTFHESLEKSGDLSASLLIYFFKENRKLDFSNINERLVTSVILLRIDTHN